jgi:hypothetical protein
LNGANAHVAKWVSNRWAHKKRAANATRDVKTSEADLNAKWYYFSCFDVLQLTRSEGQ